MGERLEHARRLAEPRAHPGHDAGGRWGDRRLDAYIRRQHEHTYSSAGEWNFELAALQSSSYLKLPTALAWAVGNANYHHVHHLSARIPNNHLRAAHEQQPMFAHTPVVTTRNSIDALRLKLWDEECGWLVGYPARRARPAAATDPVEELAQIPS